MCGINGIISQYLDLNNSVKKMNSITSHRGPDDNGVFLNKDNCICLGMNRLAILGIKTGVQPMYSNNNKKILVFNGEIFNFASLARDYLQKNILQILKL